MFSGHLDDREVQLLIVALRYWRTHRQDGHTRRTDPQIAPDAVDLLITKLTAMTSAPADSPASPDPPAAVDAADRDRRPS